MYEKSTQLISRPSYATPRKGALSGVTSVTSNIFETLFAEPERRKGELAARQQQQQYAQPSGGMPSWIIPAAVVGSVGLFLVLRKK